MRLTELMTANPPTCLHCGMGNTQVEPRLPALDLEREVNWGDSTYLCGQCVMKAAGLYGYIAPEQFEDLTRALGARERQIHELKAELEKETRRLQAILTGRDAEKEARSAA